MDGNLGRLIVHFGGDLTLLRQSMGEFDKIIGNSTKTGLDKVKAMGGAIQAMGMKMTMAITAPIVAMGAAAIKQASDYQEYLNRLQVALKENTALVTNFTKISRKEVGIANVSAMEMASGFADMATSLGLSTAEAADLSKTLVQLAGDMVSYKNVRRDIVTTALTGIFTGETESLKRLGVIMTEQAIEAWMLSKGVKALWKDLGQADRVMMRYAYVMDVQQNSMGDFKRTINNTANQMRLFEESVKELGTSIGEAFRQPITDAIKIVNSWIDSFIDADVATKRLVVTIAAFAAGVGPALVILGFSITQVTVALKAFKTAWMSFAALSGGWQLAIVAIGVALGSLIPALISSTKAKAEALDMQQKYNQAISDAQRPILEEKQNFTNLVRIALSYNEASEERLRLIKEIQDKYPGLLKQEKAEEVTTKALTDALDEQLLEYKQLLELKAAEARLNVTKKEALDLEDKIVEKINQRQAAQEKLVKYLEKNPTSLDKLNSPNKGATFYAEENKWVFDEGVQGLEKIMSEIKLLDTEFETLIKKQEKWNSFIEEQTKLLDELRNGFINTQEYIDKVNRSIEIRKQKDAIAEAERRSALGEIGRLQEDLKKAEEAFIDANSKSERDQHKDRMKQLQAEIDLIMGQYKLMQRLKPKESGYELKRTKSGKFKFGESPEIPSIGLEYLNPEQYKKEWDEWVQYQQSLIRKDLQNPIERSSVQDELKFWEDYEKQMLKISDLEKVFGYDYDEIAEKKSFFNEQIEKAIELFGAESKEVALLEAQYKSLGNSAADYLSAAREEAQLVSSTITEAFDLMAEALLDNLGEAKTGFDRFIQALYGSAIKGIGSMLGMAIANAVYSGTEAGKATGAAAPFTTPAFIAELVGIVMSAFAAIPAFADGGIVSGPTMALMGEYPGAKSNPEVIMPLDKLNSYLNNNQGNDVRVYGKLIGEDIYISNQRFDKRKRLLQ